MELQVKMTRIKNNIMKRFILKITGAILPACLMVIMLGTFSACEDLLEEKPKNFYSADNFFTTPERVEQALYPVYSVFSENATYGQNAMIYDCDTDISHVKGAGTGHVARDLGHYNAYPELVWLEDTWELYYKGIDRANTLLNNYTKAAVANEQEELMLKQYAAEAKFLRGMIYFDMVRYWGDVPLKLTQSMSEDDFNMPRIDRELVYDQIIKDMKEGLVYLPKRDDNERYKPGRLSKSAGYGLLARVYMYRAGYSLRANGQMERPSNYKEYYQKVVEYTDSVINYGNYSLIAYDEGNDMSGYEKLFRTYCENKIDDKETLYEIDFFNPEGNNGNSGMWGTYNGPQIHQDSKFGRANSFVKTLGLFYDKFESGDLRRDVAIADFKIDKNDKIVPYSRRNSHNWSPGKWRRNWQTGTIKNLNNTDVNLVLLRYADVLLMNAEAQNEVNDGPTAEALEYVNQVRRRAFGEDPLSANEDIDLLATGFNKDSFFEYLKIERARELCFEGFRKFDLIRWNSLAETIAATKQALDEEIAAGTQRDFTWEAGNRFTAGKHELFPIPQREIIETSYIITQNPGYAN